MPCEVVPLRVDFSNMAAVAMEIAEMLKKNEKHKNDHSRLLAKQKLMKLDRNNIHINKPKKSESVGQTLPQLPWKQKKGGFKKKLIPFMKFCRNIHRSVWQLLGVEKIQNGSCCHGNQGAKNVKFTPNSGSF